MPDDTAGPLTGPLTAPVTGPAEGTLVAPGQEVPPAEASGGPATDVVVHRAHAPAGPAWRRRVLAVRAELPALARNPVVVGLSTVAATVAARVVVEVVRQALGTSAPARPTALDLTGRLVHQVQVVQRVDVVHHVAHHVVHHVVDQAVRPGLPPSRC